MSGVFMRPRREGSRPNCRWRHGVAWIRRCCRRGSDRCRLTPVQIRKPAVPFKLHAEHRHHIPKPRYRVTAGL